MGLLSTGAKAVLDTGRVSIAALVELDFSFGIERWWSGIHPLSYEGSTWNPVGHLGEMTPLESSQDLRANGIELSLYLPMEDGQPLARFEYIVPSQYKNRSARVIMAFFTAGFQSVVHAMERNYYMDTLDYEVGSEGGRVTLRVESELLRGARKSVRRWTDEQQRTAHPDDKGLQYLSYLASGVEVKWGAAGKFFKG